MKVAMGDLNDLLVDDLELLLREITEFTENANKPETIPQNLENYLQFVASTGNTVFPWQHVRLLFRLKMMQAIGHFGGDSCSTESSVVERFDLFRAAPFTIQRFAELIITPEKHYKKKEKFLNGLEKTVLVVSTVEPKALGDNDIRNGNENSNSSMEIDGEIFSDSTNLEHQTFILHNDGDMDADDLDDDVLIDPLGDSTTPSEFVAQSDGSGQPGVTVFETEIDPSEIDTTTLQPLSTSNETNEPIENEKCDDTQEFQAETYIHSNQDFPMSTGNQDCQDISSQLLSSDGNVSTTSGAPDESSDSFNPGISVNDNIEASPLQQLENATSAIGEPVDAACKEQQEYSGFIDIDIEKTESVVIANVCEESTGSQAAVVIVTEGAGIVEGVTTSSYVIENCGDGSSVLINTTTVDAGIPTSLEGESVSVTAAPNFECTTQDDTDTGGGGDADAEYVYLQTAKPDSLLQESDDIIQAETMSSTTSCDSESSTDITSSDFGITPEIETVVTETEDQPLDD